MKLRKFKAKTISLTFQQLQHQLEQLHQTFNFAYSIYFLNPNPPYPLEDEIYLRRLSNKIEYTKEALLSKREEQGLSDSPLKVHSPCGYVHILDVKTCQHLSKTNTRSNPVEENPSGATQQFLVKLTLQISRQVYLWCKTNLKLKLRIQKINVVFSSSGSSQADPEGTPPTFHFHILILYKSDCTSFKQESVATVER